MVISGPRLAGQARSDRGRIDVQRTCCQRPSRVLRARHEQEIAAASGFRAVQSTPLAGEAGHLAGVVSAHYPRHYALPVRWCWLASRDAGRHHSRRRACNVPGRWSVQAGTWVPGGDLPGS